MTEYKTTFEAYSYRSSSRFGSRVWIHISDDTVEITGPRIGKGIYTLWTGTQVILFWSIIPVLLAAAVYREWRIVLIAGCLVFLHWMVGGVGAGCLWEMVNLSAFVEKKKGETVTFPRSSVNDVRIGKGWARKGLWAVIPPFVAPVNKWAEGLCVSFEAPEGSGNSQVVYALHMQSADDAGKLAESLQSLR